MITAATIDDDFEDKTFSPPRHTEILEGISFCFFTTTNV